MTHRATLVSFDAATHTCRARLDGSAAQALDDVTVARNIPASELVAGRRLLLEAGESGSLRDLVVVAVYE